MTKREKQTAFNEAIKEAIETLKAYKGEDIEELAQNDMGDLLCLGSLFSCFCPEQSGISEEWATEETENLNKRAKLRKQGANIWNY